MATDKEYLFFSITEMKFRTEFNAQVYRMGLVINAQTDIMEKWKLPRLVDGYQFLRRMRGYSDGY